MINYNSDQGLLYAAPDYTTQLLECGEQISMAEAGQSAQKGYAKPLIRAIKHERAVTK